MNIKIYPAKINECVKWEHFRTWESEVTPPMAAYEVRLATIPDDLMLRLGPSFDARNLHTINEKAYLSVQDVINDAIIIPYVSYAVKCPAHMADRMLDSIQRGTWKLGRRQEGEEEELFLE